MIKPDGLYQISSKVRALYRWQIFDPVRFDSNLRVRIQALGSQNGRRYLPLTDDISSVAFWYQTEPHVPLPTLLEKDFLEDN